MDEQVEYLKVEICYFQEGVIEQHALCVSVHRAGGRGGGGAVPKFSGFRRIALRNLSSYFVVFEEG